jgi:hypothetical protein
VLRATCCVDVRSTGPDPNLAVRRAELSCENRATIAANLGKDKMLDKPRQSAQTSALSLVAQERLLR